MDAKTMFDTYVARLTNNPELTSAILRIFDAADGDIELVMRSLAALCGYEMAEFIMQLYDTAYGNEPALCVHPSYNDATVENEARPKCQSAGFVVPIKSNVDIAKPFRDHMRWQHIRKFDPFLEQEIIKFNNMNEFQKLLYLTTKEMSQKFKTPTRP
jgi:hypothetical protein